MSHSSFKRKATEFGAGVGRCPCGQTFECESEQELAMKCRMHCRFCSNPPVGPYGQTFECESEQELVMKCRMHHRFCSNQ